MRALGIAALLIAAVVLGYWTLNVTAPEIEADINARTEQVVASSAGGVFDVATDGRRSRLEGIAETEAEKQRLLEAAGSVPGALPPEDGIEVMPRFDPYELRIEKTAGGGGRIVGAAPSAEDRDTIVELAQAALGEELQIEIALGSGAPRSWARRVAAGVAALRVLDSGALIMTGLETRLEGLSKSEGALARAQRVADLQPALSWLPRTKAWGLALTLDRPKISPFEFGVRWSGLPGAPAAATGFAPDEAAQVRLLERVAAVTGSPPRGRVSLAQGAPGPDWTDRVSDAIAALSVLPGGELIARDEQLFFEGAVATLDEVEAAAAALREIAPDLQLTLTARDPRPSAEVSLSKAADAQTVAVGLLPGDLTAQSFAAAFEQAAGAPVDVAGLSGGGRGEPETFAAAAAALGTAAAALESFEAEIGRGEGRLQGIARSEQAVAAVRAAAPSSWTLNVVYEPPLVDVFVLTAEKTADGVVRLSGLSPSADATDTLSATFGGDASDVQLARGAPEGWLDAALAAAPALAVVEAGVLSIEGLNATLSAEAATPEAAAEALAEIAENAPAVRAEVVPRDPRRAAALYAEKNAGEPLRVSGRLPSELDRAAAVEIVGFDLGDTSFDGRGDADAWARDLAVLGAAASLERLELEISMDAVRLDGLGRDPAVIEATRAAAVAAGRPWSLSLELAPPILSPYPFDAEIRGDGAWRVSGAAPSQADLDRIAAAARAAAGQADLALDLRVADGAPEGWTDRVALQIGLLGVLEQGRLRLRDEAVSLDGAPPAPAIAAAPAPDVSPGRPATAIAPAPAPPAPPADPPRLVVLVSPNGGVKVSGLLPAGVSTDEALELLGVDEAAGALRSGGAGDPEAWRQGLTTLGEVLPEFENLEATVDIETATVRGEIAKGSDPEQVETLMRSAAAATGVPPGDVAVDVAPVVETPAEGAERENPVSGRAEVFRNGYWLPKVDVAMNEGAVEACARASDLVLFDNEIRFQFDSADLDVRARTVINELSAIALECLADPATPSATHQIAGLEIGGHSDSVGEADYNLRLSQARANAVRAALVERGAPAGRLRSVGYGETTPIALNATREGRAANRRISFRWLR